MKWTRVVILVSVMFLTCTRPVFASEWGGLVETVDGVLHVHNPAEPIEGERVLVPERLWSIGGETSEDDPLFGAINDVLADRDGNTYLLDTQLLQVMVLDPGGAFLRTIGRGGDGPGEFRMPMLACFLTDDLLAVVQMTPARVVVFDRAGEPQPEFSLPVEGGFATVMGFQPAGEHVVIAVQNSSFEASQITVEGQLLVVDRSGNVRSTLWTRDRVMNMSKMVIGRQDKEVLPLWAAGVGGHVFYSAGYNQYRIEEFDTDGNALRVIDRPYESRKRTQEELDRVREQIDRVAQAGRFEVDLDETDRDILGLYPRDEGELWVTSSRWRDAPKTGQLGPFEVFDAEGRYVRDLRITAEFNADLDTWHITPDRLYVIRGGQSAIRSAVAGATGVSLPGPDAGAEDEDPEPPEVVCYRLGSSDG